MYNLLHCLWAVVATVARTFVAVVLGTHLHCKVVLLVGEHAVHKLCAVAHDLEQGGAQQAYVVRFNELIDKVALHLYGESVVFMLEWFDVGKPSVEDLLGNIILDNVETLVPFCI